MRPLPETVTVPGTRKPFCDTNVAAGTVEGASAESRNNVTLVPGATPLPVGRCVTMLGRVMSNGAVVNEDENPANEFPDRS